IVKSEGKLVGYAVLKTSGTGESRSCEIADILVRPDYPGAVELIVCDSANHAKAVGAVSLSCRMLNNHPYVSALRRMGFVRLRSPSGAHWIKLTVRNLRKNADIEEILKKGDIRVHIMVGDTDGI
ncbi:MAG: GNAT family N-acetyltransferase, partial [Methanomassiliicoccales archaeon]|nr:GNAT family N-acetyltransferase [Methanomassiliicoccales archaeon]